MKVSIDVGRRRTVLRAAVEAESSLRHSTHGSKGSRAAPCMLDKRFSEQATFSDRISLIGGHRLFFVFQMDLTSNSSSLTAEADSF
jgi:hypothetical protein